MELANWLAAVGADLDAWLEPRLGPTWPKGFQEAMRYPVFGGGKRVRPALVLAAFEAVAPGADRAKALPAAAALELVHTYSLVHDDLPAMDDDDERRGRPTVHVAFDEATAILVGDALLTHAFGLLAQAALPAEVRLDLIARLAEASGHHGMIGGQVADIAGGALDVETLTRLHRMKTGALLEASAWAGGRVAEADPSQLAALEAYGAAVGLAFQLADDILDAEEDAGDDGPPSFVRLLGLEATRAAARQQAELAHQAAGLLPFPGRLQALARYIVERER